MTTFARSLALDRPRGARGLLPLLLGAYAVGKGIYGAVNANQIKQRNKGYIEDAYRGAVQRQNVHETDVRQNTAESLNARGLLSGGPQFTQTSPSLTQSAYAGGTPTTLGGQQEADTNRELALERHDLDAAHTRATNENKADYLNALVSAGTNTAQGIMSAYGTSQTMAATSALGAGSPAAAGKAPAASGFVDSIPPGTQFHPTSGEVMGQFGFDAHTAMPQTQSAYAMRGTVPGVGQSNADFHVG
jgi:hypothetical protein